MLTAVSAAIFFTVLATVAAAGYWIIVREPQPEPAAGPAPANQSNAEREYDEPSLPTWIEGLGWLGERAPLGDPDREAVRRRLASAGYRQDWAVKVFFGAKALLMVALPSALLVWGLAAGGDATMLVLACLLGAYVGLTWPDRHLRRRTVKRRAELRRSLPDFLDLLVLAIESGVSLDQAIENTANDLSRAHPTLADEFRVTSREIIAGANRSEALRNLGRRTGEPEVRKLASLLIQADRFGSSVAKVLRTQARYMRVKRRQRSEEQAHKVGIKIIFPVFLLIMPAVFLVTAGPAVIMLMGSFSRMASGL